MGAYSRDAIRLAALGGAYFGLLLLFFLPAALAAGWRNFHVEDSWMYAGFADLIADRGLLHDAGEVNEYVRARMPVYPLLLLALRPLSTGLGISEGAAATLANIGFVIAAALLFHLAVLRSLGDRRIAFAAGAAVLVTPGVAPYVFAHMPEALTLFLWGAVAACLALRNRSFAPWAAGVLAGVAALTKPVSLLVALMLVPILVMASPERRPRRAVLFGLGLMPLPALWLVRNWLLWGAVVITPNSGTHLYDYLRSMLREAQGFSNAERHPLTGAPLDPRVPTTAVEWKAKFGFEYENLGKRTALLGRLASEEIFADPLGYAKLAAARQPRLYAGAGTQALYTMTFPSPEAARAAVNRSDWLWASGWWAYQFAAAAVLLFGYALGAVGVWRGLRDPRLRTAVLVCCVIILVQAAVVGPFGHTRYRFLMTPFFGALAAVGLAKLRSRHDQVVPVDDLLPARAGEQLSQLRGRAAHDPPGLVGGVVR